MPFEAVYHPDVKKIDLPRLDARSKPMIKRAIEERLSNRPELFSRPPRGSLRGYWKLRVEGYRIVFKLFEEKYWRWQSWIERRCASKAKGALKNSIVRMVLNQHGFSITLRRESCTVPYSIPLNHNPLL